MENFSVGVKCIFRDAENLKFNQAAGTISFDLAKNTRVHTLEISETLHAYMKMIFRSTAISFEIQNNEQYIADDNRDGTFIRAVISKVMFNEVDSAMPDEDMPRTGFGLADLARFEEEHPQ